LVAERLRRKTEALAVASESGEVHFTVSIGLATSRKDTQFDAVVESADQALYRAKQGGRNRVEFEDQGAPGGRAARSASALRAKIRRNCPRNWRGYTQAQRPRAAA